MNKLFTPIKEEFTEWVKLQPWFSKIRGYDYKSCIDRYEGGFLNYLFSWSFTEEGFTHWSRLDALCLDTWAQLSNEKTKLFNEFMWNEKKGEASSFKILKDKKNLRVAVTLYVSPEVEVIGWIPIDVNIAAYDTVSSLCRVLLFNFNSEEELDSTIKRVARGLAQYHRKYFPRRTEKERTKLDAWLKKQPWALDCLLKMMQENRYLLAEFEVRGGISSFFPNRFMTEEQEELYHNAL